MIELVWDKGFERSYRKRIRINPILRDSFRHAIQAFSENPFDPALRTHRLTGRLAGLWAFTVDEDCRVVFNFIDGGSAALLIDVGSHNEVY